MYNCEYDANNALSSKKRTQVQNAISDANAQADSQLSYVCITTTGEVETLSEFTVNVRDDIAEVVYSTDAGYFLNTKKAL